MKKILLLLLAAFSSMYANAAFQTIYGQEVVITNSVENDLYISAGNVRIEAPVHGDVLILGGTVTISSNVTGSIFVLGGELIFSGWVDGNLRCAGGKVNITGTIMKDLVVASGDVTCEKKSIVNGGILAAGGKLAIDGMVKQNVQSYAGTTNISGDIQGELNCRGDAIYIDGTIGRNARLAANDIQIGENAAFQDRVNYWTGDGDVDFRGSMFDRKPVFDNALAIKQPDWQLLGFASVLYLLWYLLASLCVIILFQYLLRKFFLRSANRDNTMTGKSFAYGLIFMIILPALIILSIISLIGIPIGVLLIMLLSGLAIFNSILLSIFAANWINNKYIKNWGNNKIIGIAFAIFIGIKIITLVPFIGWLILFVLSAIMFGSIVRNNILKERHRVAKITSR